MDKKISAILLVCLLSLFTLQKATAAVCDCIGGMTMVFSEGQWWEPAPGECPDVCGDSEPDEAPAPVDTTGPVEQDTAPAVEQDTTPAVEQDTTPTVGQDTTGSNGEDTVTVTIRPSDQMDTPFLIHNFDPDQQTGEGTGKLPDPILGHGSTNTGIEFDDQFLSDINEYLTKLRNGRDTDLPDNTFWAALFDSYQDKSEDSGNTFYAALKGFYDRDSILDNPDYEGPPPSNIPGPGKGNDETSMEYKVGTYTRPPMNAFEEKKIDPAKRAAFEKDLGNLNGLLKRNEANVARLKIKLKAQKRISLLLENVEEYVGNLSDMNAEKLAKLQENVNELVKERAKGLALGMLKHMDKLKKVMKNLDPKKREKVMKIIKAVQKAGEKGEEIDGRIGQIKDVLGGDMGALDVLGEIAGEIPVIGDYIGMFKDAARVGNMIADYGSTVMTKERLAEMRADLRLNQYYFSKRYEEEIKPQMADIGNAVNASRDVMNNIQFAGNPQQQQTARESVNRMIEVLKSTGLSVHKKIADKLQKQLNDLSPGTGAVKQAAEKSTSQSGSPSSGQNPIGSQPTGPRTVDLFAKGLGSLIGQDAQKDEDGNNTYRLMHTTMDDKQVVQKVTVTPDGKVKTNTKDIVAQANQGVPGKETKKSSDMVTLNELSKGMNLPGSERVGFQVPIVTAP